MFFKTGLKPLGAELKGVFGLNALRVASELGDERLECGHVRHAYLQGLGVYNWLPRADEFDCNTRLSWRGAHNYHSKMDIGCCDARGKMSAEVSPTDVS